MKIKNIVTAATSMVLLFSLVVPSFAKDANKSDYIISDEAVAFLKEHNVDLSPFKNSTTSLNAKIYSEDRSHSLSLADLYDDKILSFVQQVKAYNFNDEQIQQYVKGMVETPPIIINDDSNTNNKAFGVTNPPYSQNRPGDLGIGYEVKSNPGFYEATAFVTLPSSYYRPDNTSGFLFYSVSSPLSDLDNWGIDVGLWLSDGWDGIGWRGVYTAAGQESVPVTGRISALTPGKEVYLIGKVRDDGYLECQVLDAQNFNIVYVDFIYYVGNRNIWGSNAIFNRQITLCEGKGNFSNGAYMLNSKFSNAYLYSHTTGYAPVSSANTQSNRRGIFGTNNIDRNKVTLNSYTQWDSEDVTIIFNP